MRKMSEARKRLATQAGALAALGGMPVLLKGHPSFVWVWMVLEVAMVGWLIVQMVRLRRMEGCA